VEATFHPQFEELILSITGSSGIEACELLQELWSGYGRILRISLTGGAHASVVVKLISLPLDSRHPRGWNTDRSHARKVKSYEVETRWYRDWSMKCGELCRVPRLLAFDQVGEETLLVLEDLDSAGFPARNLSEVKGCLRWLAHFHATFMGEEPKGLWETGTYWHLATRPDEWDALESGPLKDAAEEIDDKLTQATYQTIVHGDAKLANFCFSPSGDGVAAVDFQYVGGGCGMKDVAYLIGSCLSDSECEGQESDLLDFYFKELQAGLLEKQPDLDPEAVIAEWRGLFPVAWTDFHRFLKGWSPGHWKLNSYSERVARSVLEAL
jgi:hypothetical protein